jgi:hypothetical protein
MLSLRKLKLSLKKGLETLCYFKLLQMGGNSIIMGFWGREFGEFDSESSKWD